MTETSGRSVRVQWRAFELNATTPEGALDARRFYIQKLGGEHGARVGEWDEALALLDLHGQVPVTR